MRLRGTGDLVLMRFVPLKTFCWYSFGREMVEESGVVLDWRRM